MSRGRGAAKAPRKNESTYAPGMRDAKFEQNAGRRRRA
jgi:hypothetical protein